MTVAELTPYSVVESYYKVFARFARSSPGHLIQRALYSFFPTAKSRKQDPFPTIPAADSQSRSRSDMSERSASIPAVSNRGSGKFGCANSPPQDDFFRTGLTMLPRD